LSVLGLSERAATAALSAGRREGPVYGRGFCKRQGFPVGWRRRPTALRTVPGHGTFLLGGRWGPAKILPRRRARHQAWGLAWL